MNFIYPYLPLINSVVTIIFIILGITGAIMFGMGIKFKNVARNVYSSVRLITTFICMLIIFHLTYCPLVIPTNSEDKNQVPPEVLPKVLHEHEEPIAIQDGGGGPKMFGSKMFGSKMFDSKMFGSKMAIPNLPKSITNGVGNIFSFINNLIKNNAIPFIIVQVLCITIIVIVSTLMSAIYGGIAKAGYEMHCSASNEVFNIPWWGNLVDFFMHILLIISSIYAIIYFIIKLFTDISTSIPGSSYMTDKMPSGVRKIFAKYFNIMNDWPIIRGTFIISLSYYIIQLLLRLFEDFISYIIVSFSNWQKRETECSDEPNKNSKTDMERMITLIINIIIFIILVIITIVLLIINIFYSPVIIQFLTMGSKFYIPAAVAISGHVDLKSIKKIISQATNGKVNEQKIQEISDKVLATLENSGEKFDLKQMFGSINSKNIDPAPAPASAPATATAPANEIAPATSGPVTGGPVTSLTIPAPAPAP
jgi:hypothetical protein